MGKGYGPRKSRGPFFLYSMSLYLILSRCLTSQLRTPRFAYEEFGVGAFARRVLLDAAVSHFCGVQSSFAVRDEAMHAPHAAQTGAKRTPRVEEMPGSIAIP